MIYFPVGTRSITDMQATSTYQELSAIFSKVFARPVSARNFQTVSAAAFVFELLLPSHLESLRMHSADA